jgi:hypothetical protein
VAEFETFYAKRDNGIGNTRSYYRKEGAASGLRNQKQPRSQAQEKAWERGWIKSTPKGSKAACTIC